MLTLNPPFPPSFEGNPVGYGVGLFGDVVAASLALTMLIGIVLESRRNREISRQIKNRIEHVPTPKWTPLFIYRASTVSMLLFIVLRALPDAIWMLAWGEVSDDTTRTLLTIDLWADGFALGPFFFSVMCWAWGRQVIPHRLLSGLDERSARRPPWSLLWRNARIVLLVMIIAVGVTIGKASA